MTFRGLVGDLLGAALEKQGITDPTEIQKSAIPASLEGRDIVAASPTGTGKTLAYLLPIFCGLEFDIKSERRIQALVLAPTYELAAQIHAQARLLWENAGFDKKIAPILLIGGASPIRQIAALKDKPSLAIGSPGRVADLIRMKKLRVHFVKTIVLDEWDRLIDKNGQEHIGAILKAIPKDRQTLLISATAPRNKLPEFLREPVFVNQTQGEAEAKFKMPETLRHSAIICERRDKFTELRRVINRGRDSDKGFKALVFVKDGGEAERTAERLNHHGIKAEALWADLSGSQRKTAIGRLREGRITVLTATDAAARGIDIPGLPWVISMEPPWSHGEYLHRAGRAGRMGTDGMSLTFATPKEKTRLEAIGRVLDIDIKIDIISTEKMMEEKNHDRIQRSGKSPKRSRPGD